MKLALAAMVAAMVPTIYPPPPGCAPQNRPVVCIQSFAASNR